MSKLVAASSLLRLLVSVASPAVEGATSKDKGHAASAVGSEKLAEEHNGERALGDTSSGGDNHVGGGAGDLDLHKCSDSEEEGRDTCQAGGAEELAGDVHGFDSEEAAHSGHLARKREERDVEEDSHAVRHPNHLPHTLLAFTKEALDNDRLDGSGETRSDTEQDTLA
ncbi:hypothetical protein HG531_007566 [Fusarium graminearum]|nr:hypothetical protein HG531_007566 [Fusarium graminearum]